MSINSMVDIFEQHAPKVDINLLCLVETFLPEIECKDVKGKYHRECGKPARVSRNQGKKWYLHGKLHSYNDTPAQILSQDGDICEKLWYKNGKKHRDGDLPAWIAFNGTKTWYKDGYIHRDEDKPAIIHADGSSEYFISGFLHREGNKPARIFWEFEEWWINGNKIRRENHPQEWLDDY